MKTRLFGWFSAPDVIERSAHDALMAEKEARIVALTMELGDWKATTRRAMSQIEALTKPEPVAPVVVPSTPAPRQPNIVLDTIRDLAAGDLRMMQYLHQRKRELRAENPRISDDLLALELMKWETSDDLLEVQREG